MINEGFPRGGKKTTKNEDKRSKSSSYEAADGDVKKKGKDKNSAEYKKNNFMKLDKKLELPSISYDTLVEGTLCLGCVKKVQENNLLVGLPGMTVGVVDIRSISTPYTQILEKLEKDEPVQEDEVIYPLDSMFKPGDIVVVKVMNVVLNEDGKHRITLSLDPSDIHDNWRATDLTEDIVMTGAVKSKEDKGYIIDLGIKGVSAFLPQTSASVTEKKLQKPLGIGQLISVNITNCQIKRLMARVTLNSITSKIKQVSPPEGVAVKILPGMKVSCIIVEKRSSGLMVSFLDSCIGRVHNDHLGERHRADVSDTVYGRIMFIPPWDVGPYLTFDEVNSFPYSTDPIPQQQLQPGDSRRRRGTVTLLEPRGANVRLHGGGTALLKRQRASDKMDYTDEQFKKDFKVRSEHDFRVLEYSSLDGLFIVSCQEHLMDPNIVITKDELTPGSVHTVTIVSYNQGGAVVKLGNVKGFIPYLHFKDKVLSPQFVQRKYPPASQVLAKVFQVDLSKNSALFTAKKTLRQSKGLVASSFAEIKIGSIGHGIIRFIAPKEAGLRIQMIGGLFGFVPKGKIPSSEMDSKLKLEDRFPIGSPIEFKVLEISIEKARAILTLDTSIKEEVPEKNKNPKKKGKKRKISPVIEDENSVVSSNNINQMKKQKKSIVETVHQEIESDDEDKIPTLIPISQNRKRKLTNNNDNDEKVKEKLVSKKKKKSDESKEAQGKLSKKEKKKLKQKHNKATELQTSIKEEEDSGIDDETSALKLTTTQSFWDVVPPSMSNDDDQNQNESSEPEEESDSDDDDVKIEFEENGVKSAQDTQTNKKKGKTDKKLSKTDSDVIDSMTEKDHELRLIQNSSDPKHWRNFKDFALRNGDPGKAVCIIKRMKDKIPFRDEKGKLYCWMTILQIETQYGTEDSVKAILDEAMKVNDPTAVLDKCAQLYENIDKKDEAEELYRRRLKMKLHQSDSWLNLGSFLYKNEKLDAARQLLPSALQQLSDSNQIYVTAKFAKMEIEHGEIEKGREMFLTICLQRPKRIDLWLLYANSLYKIKQFQLAADALRTALSSKQLSPKDCRPLLKRLVEIEKLHGTPESLSKLKSEAAGYLNLAESSTL